MSLGQSMLTAAALIIITMVVISANRLILESQQDEFSGEAYNLASEIANSMLMEASRKKFDENFTSSYYQDVWEFADPTSLGASLTESSAVPLPDHAPFKSIGAYDDFSDYNGYERIVDTPVITGFIVRDSVCYVNPTDPDTPLDYQSYVKKLVVKVSHPIYLPKPLEFSTLMSY
jgi:hypothetical protein